MHARQLPLQHRRIRLHQAFYAARAFRAGDRPDTSPLANQVVIADLALDQQQVAAVLGQGQGVLGLFGHQQVDLLHTLQIIARYQAQLQLQGNTAVRHFDLQCMAQGAQQLATADGIGQVVLATVATVEEHQGAAVIERVGFAFVQRRRLFQAVAVTLQQLGQACAWQTAQLLLGAQLDR